MITSRVELPRPHAGQKAIIEAARRFNVLCCGRRFGKTLLGEEMAAHPALAGHPVGWLSPTYKDLLEVWRDLTRILAPVISRANSTERRIELVTGGVIEMWSAVNRDGGRGRKYARLIVDESALISDLWERWNLVLRATLADLVGDAWFLSTPKGHNGFWKLYNQDGDAWARFVAPTWDNPHIPPEEIEALRRALSERAFAQEIEARFLEDAGGVFRGVVACATAEEAEPQSGRQYIFGVDWGKSNDFTVIVVMDAESKAMVAMDRFNKIDYSLQSKRLNALAEQYRPDAIVAETNAMGEPVIERLEEEGLPVQRFTTTQATKRAAIEALALAFERRQIAILNDATLVSELQAYEMERMKSGAFRYSAPEGMHDDTVMALALAWHGVNDVPWLMF